MTWTGRELTSHDGVTYKYNADGLRTSKKLADGKKIEYYYSGNKLVFEHREINYEGNPDGLSMFYTYDDGGNISNIRYIIDSIGYEHNYYPVCNSRGDVVEIYSYYGVLTAKYTYDTWGEILSITDANGNDIYDPMHIGTLNPFRYRGYYYDTETGSYYLQSRYYDPGVKRFFNADGVISGTGESVQGNNLFVYCNNNPVNMTDENGYLPKWVSGALNVVSGALQMAAGAALGATVGWTGVGAVVGGFLVINGAATVTQGVGQIVNSVTKSNTMREDNIIKTGVQAVGKTVGGKTGEKVAGVVYDTAVVAANIYAGKVALENSMPKIIESKIFSANNGYGFKVGKNIEMFYRNPNAAGGLGGTILNYKGSLGKFRIDWDPAHGFHCHPPGH